ncbi:DUF3298 domain-containing protein [Niastella caeni]|uniref:DUF3298 domain-containing protein n=1 Tax=Niastella caeni TaxID=2569763 RepID=A0A4S8HSR3_9BACT|nr:RsiV family protein [Niastella caeni]THU37014.1 DUF3298 domain-containing protein [Niastella caeni]
MRQTFILLFILGSFHAALAQKSNAAPVITRYYFFTGTIDKFPVTFHLYRINEQFSGIYYYNSTEVPIAVYGILKKDQFLKLAHNDQDGEVTEEISGNFKDSSFSGTWQNKGKMLPFRVALPQNSHLLAFDYIYTEGSKKLTGDGNNRDALSYDAATIWPAASSKHPATNLIKEIIYEAFDEKQSQEPIGKIMINEKNEILNQGKEEDAPTYALSRKVQVEYRNARLLTLSKFIYTDGGGVHGNYGTQYICIDLVNNHKLAITDVLDTLACRETLRTLLAKKFRTKYKVKPEEKLSEYLFNDTIAPGNNFMLTSKGIAFNYVPYEIAAYALGEVFLYIPYKELSGCLKPEFKQLIGIVGQ